VRESTRPRDMCTTIQMAWVRQLQSLLPTSAEVLIGSFKRTELTALEDGTARGQRISAGTLHIAPHPCPTLQVEEPEDMDMYLVENTIVAESEPGDLSHTIWFSQVSGLEPEVYGKMRNDHDGTRATLSRSCVSNLSEVQDEVRGAHHPVWRVRMKLRFECTAMGSSNEVDRTRKIRGEGVHMILLQEFLNIGMRSKMFRFGQYEGMAVTVAGASCAFSGSKRMLQGPQMRPASPGIG
jgi:hypothetical protein